MEDALVHAKTFFLTFFGKEVLILVLMEDALVRYLGTAEEGQGD